MQDLSILMEATFMHCMPPDGACGATHSQSIQHQHQPLLTR